MSKKYCFTVEHDGVELDGTLGKPIVWEQNPDLPFELVARMASELAMGMRFGTVTICELVPLAEIKGIAIK